MDKKLFNLFKYLFIIISLLISGCHAEIPFIEGGISAGKFNKNKTKTAFLYNARVSIRATGISAFPDGGAGNFYLQSRYRHVLCKSVFYK